MNLAKAEWEMWTRSIHLIRLVLGPQLYVACDLADSLHFSSGRSGVELLRNKFPGAIYEYKGRGVIVNPDKNRTVLLVANRSPATFLWGRIVQTVGGQIGSLVIATLQKAKQHCRHGTIDLGIHFQPMNGKDGWLALPLSQLQRNERVSLLQDPSELSKLTVAFLVDCLKSDTLIQFQGIFTVFD